MTPLLLTDLTTRWKTLAKEPTSNIIFPPVESPIEENWNWALTVQQSYEKTNVEYLRKRTIFSEKDFLGALSGFLYVFLLNFPSFRFFTPLRNSCIIPEFSSLNLTFCGLVVYHNRMNRWVYKSYIITAVASREIYIPWYRSVWYNLNQQEKRFD